MTKIVTKVDVIRRVIGLGVCTAISVVAFGVFPLFESTHPGFVAVTFLGAAFLAICYFIGILIAWSEISNQNFLKKNNFNIDLELDGGILIDKAQRKFCLLRGTTPSSFLSWDKIRSWELEWETKNNYTRYYICFDVDDFTQPRIRHQLGAGPGFGPKDMAQKTVAQIGMLIKGEA